MSRHDQGCRGDLELGTIPRMLRLSAQRFGALPAIVDEGVPTSFASLLDEVRAASRGLLALGFAHGDRAAIWAPNGKAWIVAALAVHGLGGVLVPINTRFKGAEAAALLRASRARVLFTVERFLGTDYLSLLAQSHVALPDLRHTVLLGEGTREGTLCFSRLSAIAEHVPEAEADARALAVTPDDRCDILFTSGTTGHPKGVPCTHAQTLRAFRDWSETVGLRPGDRYLVVLPFFHSFGYKAGWLACLMRGATILPQSTLDAGLVLARIARDRVSVLPGPPALFQTLLARPDLGAHDLSSLRLAVTGAAVVPVELVRRMRDELGFQTIITGYGLTETSGVVSMCHFDDDPETIATTSGRPIPGVEVKVVGDDDRELPRGSPGEILVRGYNVMEGYLDDPEETAAVKSPEGWLRTGDVGTMNERGYLTITDRKKDLFIVGGFNAYPAEIERTLLAHPAVAQAAVVGMPDDRLGEVGAAFLILRPGATVEPEEILAHCRETMANYKVPRRVSIVGELPVNATGKVLKYRLREQLLREVRASAAGPAPLNTPEG